MLQLLAARFPLCFNGDPMRGLVALLVLALSPSIAAPHPGRRQEPARASDQTTLTYFCPMHSDVTSESPGSCRRCGMALVAGTAFDTTDYALTFETTPRLVWAGEQARLVFRVSHPRTGEPVRDFTVVHDEPYHLFVVSQDMNTFFHLAPTQQSDGSFAIDLTVPAPGPYRVYSDFLPAGGTPQIIARPLLTAGFHGDLQALAARLVPDPVPTKTVDDLGIELRLEPRQPISGRETKLTFHLTDARTGQLVTDLQPYLGAWGHTLVLSEDLIEYIHSHPVDQVPAGARATLAGGPMVTFEAFFPKPGLYRSWTQFKRRDRIATVTFTFRVYRLGETSLSMPQ